MERGKGIGGKALGHKGLQLAQGLGLLKAVHVENDHARHAPQAV